MTEELLKELTYSRRLLSDQEITIILLLCREKLSHKEIAARLTISKGTLRRYLSNIRAKLYNDICDYAYQLKESKLDISLLWKRTSEYDDIARIITACQQEPDNTDLDNDPLEEILKD